MCSYRCPAEEMQACPSPSTHVIKINVGLTTTPPIHSNCAVRRRRKLGAAAPRVAYYPGSEGKAASFCRRFPDAEQFGDGKGGAAPWRLQTGLTPDQVPPPPPPPPPGGGGGGYNGRRFASRGLNPNLPRDVRFTVRTRIGHRFDHLPPAQRSGTPQSRVGHRCSMLAISSWGSRRGGTAPEGGERWWAAALVKLSPARQRTPYEQLPVEIVYARPFEGTTAYAAGLGHRRAAPLGVGVQVSQELAAIVWVCSAGKVHTC